MKLLAVLLLGLVTWDYLTAPHGTSAAERGYQAVITSGWFHSALAAGSRR